MPPFPRWEIYGCNEQGGNDSVRSFILSLTGDAKVEAFAMLKWLEECGDALESPRVSKHGDGTFAYRGNHVQFRYNFPTRHSIKLTGWSRVDEGTMTQGD